MAPRKTTAAPIRPYLGSTDPKELSPAHQVAYEIVTSRSDLLPSVDRIMGAGLDGADEARALTLFRDSLGDPADPHRDPTVAISAATGAG